MEESSTQNSFDPANLIGQVRALGDDVGPRRTWTTAEGRPDDYVQSHLRVLGIRSAKLQLLLVVTSQSHCPLAVGIFQRPSWFVNSCSGWMPTELGAGAGSCGNAYIV